MLRKDFIKDIKTLKANKKNLKNFIKEKYINDDGNAVIDIYVNKEDLYDKFSNPEDMRISKDVIDYIDEENRYIPVEYPLIIQFHTDDDIYLEHLSSKLKEVYWKRLGDKDDDLKKNSWVSIILTLIGLFFLSLYFGFQYNPNISVMFNEIFSIIGTFSLWEAVDYFLLNRSVIKIERLNIAQSVLAEIKIVK